MVHRDPETGQFVSGGGHAVERYSDYEFVHSTTIYDIDAANIPDGFPVTETDIRVVDLDDIVDRHERADLVSLRLHDLQATVPGTSSAESALEVRWELGAGVGSTQIENEDSDFNSGEGESGIVDFRTFESDSPDVLSHATWVAEGSFAESTAGVGGGPDQPVISANVHFPNEFGVCPQFDDRDEITESFRMTDVGGADISDSLVQLHSNWTLVFGVQERE